MNGNLLVAMSGGTTPVINATLAGMIQEVAESCCFDDILAGIPGIEGVLEDRLVRLGGLTPSQVARLRNTPGSAVIGTTRVAFLCPDETDRLLTVIQKRKVRAFVNVGGNGTLEQTKALAQGLGGGIQVAAAPKTVDNDLGDMECRRVFFTPGFPSCVNFWIQLVAMLNVENLGACSHDKVLVAQTFGRETGFIAGATRAADPGRQLPLMILLPEDVQPVETVVASIDDLLCRRGRAMVIISEGYPIGDIGQAHDKSGQVMFGSSQTTAAQLLVDRLMRSGIQARSVLPTVLQRQSGHAALEFDRCVAERQGRDIVRKLAAGSSSFLSTVVDPQILGESMKDPISIIPFEEARAFSRCMQPGFLEQGRFDVSDAYVAYLQSLFSVSRNERAFGSLDRGYLMPDELTGLHEKEV